MRLPGFKGRKMHQDVQNGAGRSKFIIEVPSISTVLDLSRLQGIGFRVSMAVGGPDLAFSME